MILSFNKCGKFTLFLEGKCLTGQKYALLAALIKYPKLKTGLESECSHLLQYYNIHWVSV